LIRRPGSTVSAPRRWCAALAALALASLCAAPALASIAGLRLAPATPGAVRFSIAIPAPGLTEIDQAQHLKLLDLDGFLVVGEPGAPGLPIRVVTVAVPPLGEVRVRGVASETTTLDDVLLAPEAPGTEDPGPAVLRRANVYGAAGSAVPAAARLIGIDWVRNQRVARIAIEPAAYEPGERRLTVASRIDVEVQVQPMSGLGPAAEPVDPFEATYRAVLVNYEQGRAWRRPATASLVAAARRMGIQPTRVSAAQIETTSVFAQHSWAKLAITKPGLYAVDFSSLRQLALFDNTGVPFDSLRLFTLPGYPLLPEDSYCDSCDLREVSIGTVDVSTAGGPDGSFSVNEDYFYFYAQATNGWASDFDPSKPDTLYLNHPYESKNYYLLTVATAPEPVPGPPARIGLAVPSPVQPGAVPVTTVDDRAHFEQDVEYWPNATAIGSSLFWEKWFWRSLTPGNTFTSDFALPGADSLQTARLRLRQWGLTDRLYDQGCNPGIADHNLDVTFNGFAAERMSWTGFAAFRTGQQTLDTTGTFVRSVGNHLQEFVPDIATPDCVGDIDRNALAWFDLFYRRVLQPVDDRIEFRSPAGAGTFTYDIGPFASPNPPRLFDITEPLTPIEMAPTLFEALPGGVTYHVVLDQVQASQRRYLVVPDVSISVERVPRTSLADAAPTTPRNLRGPGNAADYLVIYYDGFAAAAQALTDARRTRLPVVGRSNFETLAIPVSAIYDHFSGGRTDPAAIRNFLRGAFYNWSVKPTFVTFVGDASYDYKDITGRATPGQPACLLPTYENGFDAAVMRQYATDDWLLNVDDPLSVVPDFYGGRLPVTDAITARAVVTDKILAYETAAPIAEYRNKILLVADDDAQGEVRCDRLNWTHVFQTDDLNRRIPLHMDRQYVYLHTYPSAVGGTKPAARTDLKTQLNNGVAMFNFVGHGSPFKLSDESVFIDSDAGTLVNGLRMHLLCAASCDVGKFNDPTVQSLGERMVVTPTNGAIAVVSATEEAFSGQNAQLNRFFYAHLFQRDTLAIGQAGGDTLPGVGQYHLAISAALLAAKLDAAFSETNNSKYQVMGDAATRLNLPRLWAEVGLFDASGAPLSQLSRGQTVTFRGQVLDGPGGSPLPYDGVASLLVEDSAPIDRTPVACSGFGTTTYLYKAGPIYHGDVSAANGAFEGHFVVPMDATLGIRGRVRTYLQGHSGADPSDVDGAGALATELIAGSAPSTDVQGPTLTLSFLGGATAVRPDATLQINLYDESGIMTTGHALQNSIVVTLDDNTTSRVDVTSSFRYAADSYQSGTASYQLQNLPKGHHKVSVSAADNLATGFSAAQHRSSATLEFDVVDQTVLAIDRAYLFPNPASSGGPGSGGTFVIDAPGDSVNTLLRIYTLSGRLIRQFRSMGGLGQVQIAWDGRDGDGDALANGTYLFKVFVYSREADGGSSPSEKAVTQGRFSILNR
jgi:hypothetical protein